jgi:hypothetical protein
MNNALLEACALMDVRQINRADAHLGKGVHRDSRPKPISTKPQHARCMRGYVYKEILYADAAHTIQLKSLKAPKARSTTLPKIDLDGYAPIPAFARAPKYYPGKRRTATA